MGGEAKSAIPALMELLEDRDFFVRRTAAEALGQVGPEARAAIPALTKLLKDPNVRRTAAEALRKIGVQVPPLRP
jgi:HEAT repeat protein